MIAGTGGVGGEAAVVFDEFAAGEEEFEELVAGHVGGRAGAEADVGAVEAVEGGFEFGAGGGCGGFVDEAEDFVAVDVFGGIGIHGEQYAPRRGRDASKSGHLYTISFGWYELRRVGNVSRIGV